MIKASYDLQDKIASNKLEKMTKIVDFNCNPYDIREEFFHQESSFGADNYIADLSYAWTSVVKVEYLKYKFPEIDFEGLIEELDQNRELPIARNCIDSAKRIAETRIVRDVKETSHEVKQEYNEIENPKRENENQKED